MNKSVLVDLVDVIHNDDNSVMLAIKDNITALDLLKTGCFKGNEKYFRVTKVGDVVSNLTYTFIDENNKSWSCCTATLVTDEVHKQMSEIYKVVVYHFGIPLMCLDKRTKINNHLTIEQDINDSHVFSISGWDYNDMVLYKDGMYMGHISYNNAIEYISSKYKKYFIESKKTQTNCIAFNITTDGSKVEDNMEFDIEKIVNKLLSKAMSDDYFTYVKDLILKEVVADVVECADPIDWNEDDVRLAIGRVLIDKLTTNKR